MELARSGEYANVTEIKMQLRREGRRGLAQVLSSSELRRELLKLIGGHAG
jgi:hypothetical protein